MRLIDADAIKLYYGGLVHIPSNDFMGIANYFMNQIKEMPTVTPEPHWIPVTERLPEEEGEYLVTDDAGGVKHIEVDMLLHYEDSGEPFWLYSQNAIAWAELPEPFKGVNT